jgi:hypothetical protein
MLFHPLRVGSVLGSDKCAGSGAVYAKGATWWQKENLIYHAGKDINNEKNVPK